MIDKIIIFFLITIFLYSEKINSNEIDKLIESGNKSFYAKDFKKAKLIYESSLIIDKQNRPALNNLGMIYYYGKGVDKNLTKAINYLGKAAIRGDKNSQFYLAMSLSQINAKIFHSEILFWLEESAKQNYEKAQLLLAIAYIKGEYLEKNITRAKYWIKKAKDNNSTKAKELWNQFKFGLDKTPR